MSNRLSVRLIMYYIGLLVRSLGSRPSEWLRKEDWEKGGGEKQVVRSTDGMIWYHTPCLTSTYSTNRESSLVTLLSMQSSSITELPSVSGASVMLLTRHHHPLFGFAGQRGKRKEKNAGAWVFPSATSYYICMVVCHLPVYGLLPHVDQDQAGEIM